jgi:hypothetical protein
MCIKFCTKLDRVKTQTYEIIKTAFQEDAMTCTHIFYWFFRFKNGCTSVASDKHSGHPPSSRNDEVLVKVLDLVREDQRLTIREVTEEVGVYFCSCQSI